jgi:hypothetical protein
MSRKIKLIGLAALAVLAVSAVSASAASAAQFTSSAETTTLEGSQKTQNVFTTPAGEVKCSVAKFSGTQKGTADGGLGFTSQTATVHPTYESCTAFGFSATVNTASCNYTLHANGEVDIVNCPSTAPIKITIPIGGCNITVTNQSAKKTVTYANEAGGDVLVTANVSSIAFTSSGGLCGSSGTGASYKGSVLTNGGAANIAWDAV